MYLSRLWSMLFGERRQTGGLHDDDEHRVSVSCVRAVEGRRQKNAETIIPKATWFQTQHAEGRYIIYDSHFVIGRHLRAVPKLKDPNECFILKNAQIDFKIE